MILLTRLNGASFAVNADLIERVEQTPDTVVTMVDGRKHVVAETTAQVVDKIVDFRASILVAADRKHIPTQHNPSHSEAIASTATAPGSKLRLVPDHEGR
ncbi:MAG: flagellar FlbD family protein [Acidimicrobiia bacterium]